MFIKKKRNWTTQKFVYFEIHKKSKRIFEVVNNVNNEWRQRCEQRFVDNQRIISCRAQLTSLKNVCIEFVSFHQMFSWRISLVDTAHHATTKWLNSSILRALKTCWRNFSSISSVSREQMFSKNIEKTFT